MKVLTHLLGHAGEMHSVFSGHLSFIGIHVPQQSVQFGISHETSEEDLQRLKDFVGNRPITCSQGFPKPFA